MIHEFSPITLGECLKTANVGGFILTETKHQPNQKLSRHNHELHNIAFVLNGAFTEILDRRDIECSPQSLVIKPAGEAHANRYGRMGMRCLLIEMHPKHLEALSPWSKVFSCVEHVRSAIVSLLGMRIYKEFRNMDAASPLAIEGLILELTAELSRRGNLVLERKRPRWLEQSYEILHECFSENLSLATLAATVGVHPVHLAREFRKHFGCSLGEYLRRVRIEFASRELSNPDASLVEIAVAAGFAHQSHFSRIFKKHTGMTPSEFRAALRSR